MSVQPTSEYRTALHLSGSTDYEVVEIQNTMALAAIAILEDIAILIA
jgi:hypothetical protein